MTSWTIEWHDEVESTNDLAKVDARKGATDGTVIAAHRQQQGRGRGDHTWASPAGGLYASVILRNVPRTISPFLAFIASEAMARAVEDLDDAPRLWLKWPNDLLVAPRSAKRPEGKAGGVLVEAELSGERMTWAAIGIGLNLGTKPADLPQDTDPPAATLASYMTDPPTPDHFLEAYLDRLDKVLTQARSDTQALVQAVESRLAWKGEPVEIRPRQGRPYKAYLLGLAADGGLRMDIDGDVQVVHAWTVDGHWPVGSP